MSVESPQVVVVDSRREWEASASELLTRVGCVLSYCGKQGKLHSKKTLVLVCYFLRVDHS